MSDRKIFVEPNGSEAFQDSEPPGQLAEGQRKAEHIVFYDKEGRVINIEPPSEEEIAELLYRLENGEI